jgi:hypothetical protein
MELWSFPHTNKIRHVTTDIAQQVNLENYSEQEIQEALHYVSTQDSPKHKILWQVITQLVEKLKDYEHYTQMVIEENERLVEIIKNKSTENQTEPQEEEDDDISDTESEISEITDEVISVYSEEPDSVEKHESVDENIEDFYEEDEEEEENEDAFDDLEEEAEEYIFIPRRKRVKKIKTIRFAEKRCRQSKNDRRFRKKKSNLTLKELIAIREAAENAEDNSDNAPSRKQDKRKSKPKLSVDISPNKQKGSSKSLHETYKHQPPIQKSNNPNCESGRNTPDYGSSNLRTEFLQHEQHQGYLNMIR